MSFHPGKLIIAAALLHSAFAGAQPFNVRVERADATGNCDMKATRMAVAPSGQVTLQGVSEVTCLPDGAAGLANVAVSVPPGPGAGGAYPSGATEGIVVTVQGIPATATCTLRGITTTTPQGTGEVASGGWSDGTTLCTNCANQVQRTIRVDNFGTTSNWAFRLRVQCSIQSGGYAVQGPIVEGPNTPVTVLPATVAPGSCPYPAGTLPGHDNITIANRQTTTRVTNGINGVVPAQAVTEWTHIFGVTTGTTNVTPRQLPIPGPVAQGYGFPGPFVGQTYFELDSGKFIALKFRAPAPDSNPSGNPLWTGIYTDVRTYTAAAPTSALTFSVAPCPGQFRSVPNAPLPPACVVQEPNGFKGSQSFILVDPGIPYTGNLCPIELGKTYYWNMMATDIRGPLSNSLCGNTTCFYRMSKNPLFINGSYP